jgi:hypothetical protein
MRSLAFCLALLLIVSGCDDPSSAGLEFVNDDGARPTVTVQEASAGVEEPEVRDETGGDSRVLAGTVADPVTGSVSTTGYLDFSEPSAPPSAFRNGPVTEVTLRLVRDYVYGDTVTVGTLVLNDMDHEWTSLSVPADSELVAGIEAASVQFTPSDSVVLVALPAEWVAANDLQLRSAGSDTLFHGFQLTAIGTNAVIGFRTTSVTLDVVSGGEQLEFPVNRRLTTARRLSPTTPPAERLTVQDTAGPGVVLHFDLSDDTLATAVINRAEIRVIVDTLALRSNTPPNFVRPEVPRLELHAATTAGGSIVLGTANVDNGVAAFSGSLVRAALQGLAEGVGVVDHFRVVVAADVSSVGAVVLNAPGTGQGPTAEITASKI